MKKLTVISGKGGTGKTTLVGAFASLSAGQAVLVDGDVDAANLSLITGAEPVGKHEFYASKKAVIDPELCSECGLCFELCRFDAINENIRVDSIKCEGCAFCAYACPEQAIDMQQKLSGHWYVSDTDYGPLVHARLGIAEENSGKLVTTVRNRGEELAKNADKKHLLIDGPPGIGCPVIASLAGVDVALIVAEPSVSGIHDLERVVAVCRHFGVPAMVCINRFDLGESQSRQIEKYCTEENIPLVGKIPFDRNFVEAIVEGKPANEILKGSSLRGVINVWRNISESKKTIV